MEYTYRWRMTVRCGGIDEDDVMPVELVFSAITVEITTVLYVITTSCFIQWLPPIRVLEWSQVHESILEIVVHQWLMTSQVIQWPVLIRSYFVYGEATTYRQWRIGLIIAVYFTLHDVEHNPHASLYKLAHLSECLANHFN